MKLPMWDCCKMAYIWFAVIIVLILGYFLALRLMCKSYATACDPMNEHIYTVPGTGTQLSWWPISHFLFFTLLGYLYPQCWLFLWLAGVLWEIVEMIISKVSRTKYQWVNTEHGLEYSKNWWAGSMKDIVMNSAGIAVGVGLRKLVDKNVSLACPKK